MGVRSRTEVLGLLAAILPQRGLEECSAWPQRKRQGDVPDFLAARLEGGKNLEEARDELYELRTLPVKRRAERTPRK